jgi:hypothetical protein
MIGKGREISRGFNELQVFVYPAHVGKRVDFSIHAFHRKVAHANAPRLNGKALRQSQSYRGRPSATSFSRSSSRYSCTIR